MAVFTYSGSESFDFSGASLGLTREDFEGGERSVKTTRTEWILRHEDGLVTVHTGKGLTYGQITKAGHTITIPDGGTITKAVLASLDGKAPVLKARIDAEDYFDAVLSNSPKDDRALFAKLFKGDDVIRTGSGRDALLGYGGDDVLKSGGGADELEGGKGHDRLTGGGGADQFIFSSKKDGRDVITDFQIGLDKIVIDVKGVEADDLKLREIDGDAVIRYAKTWITLEGVSADELNQSDLLVI